MLQITPDIGVKIAVRHLIFLSELMKLLISYVDKFCKCPTVKNKKGKILKIAEIIWIITHNS